MGLCGALAPSAPLGRPRLVAFRKGSARTRRPRPTGALNYRTNQQQGGALQDQRAEPQLAQQQGDSTFLESQLPAESTELSVEELQR